MDQGRIMTDPAELRRIAGRAVAAEPGPWSRRESWHGESWEITSPAQSFPVCASQLADPKDADFIAAAREDVPNLLTTVAHMYTRHDTALRLLRAVVDAPGLDMEIRAAIAALLADES